MLNIKKLFELLVNDENLDKLEKSIQEYMEAPASQRSSEALNSMIDTWNRVKAMSDQIEAGGEFDSEDAIEWTERMKNADGSTGAHWTMKDTNSLRPADIPDYILFATLNMIYSDYCEVAKRYGVNMAEFYSDMAKAFLYYEDAKENKLGLYFNYIVK